MDPATATVAATVIAAATTAATSIMSANAQSSAAETQSQLAERQALETKSVAQRQAAEESRKAELAKSRLMAVAGASGSGASDPTVMGLMEGIDQEGRYNSAMAMNEGERRAQSTTYQAALDRWSASANSRIAKIGAAGTLIGGTMGAYGKYKTPMAMRYGSNSGAGTGY